MEPTIDGIALAELWSAHRPDRPPSRGGDNGPRSVPRPGRLRPPVRPARLRSRHRGRGPDESPARRQARRRGALGHLRDDGPPVVRSGRGAGQHQPLLVPLRDARRARETHAGQSHDAEPGRVVDGERRSEDLRVQAARGIEVPQRRPLHRRGREVQLPARQGRQDPQGEGARDRDGRSLPGAVPAPRALPRLHGLLRNPDHRRRLDCPQEAHRKGR